MTQRNYDYDCTLRRVVDADTYVLAFDLSAYWREQYMAGELADVGPEMLLPRDLGFGVHATGFLPVSYVAMVRLLGVNAPAQYGETRRQGEESTAFVERWFRRYYKLRATTHRTKSGWTKSGKFGRYLAEVRGQDRDGNTSDIGDDLVIAGLAVRR